MKFKMSKFKIATVFVVCVIVFLYNSNAAQSQERSKVNINKEWSYLENDSQNLIEIQNTSNWTTLNLPHTWNNEDVTDAEPGYRRNASWYKKNIAIVTVDKNLLYQLYFEGANITTKVYVNGKDAGDHIGGYLGFTIDITEFIKSGNNEVLVRVDNGYNPEIIPSQKSDFFIYGGITRDVWLQTVAITHIGNLKITTPSVSFKRASLQLNASINNFKKSDNLILKAALKNPQGKVVATKTFKKLSADTEMGFSEIKNPQLWDTKTPNLYSITVTLLHNKTIIDEIEDKVGFRWFEFKDYGPFYLNGKRLLLRGTHRHEEHAGVGRRHAAVWCYRQRHRAGHHRQNRHRRWHRPCYGICRLCHSWPEYGRAHDNL